MDWNKIIIISILLLGGMWSTNIAAQEVDMVALADSRFVIDYQLIGTIQDKTLVYKKTSTKIEIQAFDKQLETLWNKELELVAQKQTNILKIIPQDTSFQIVYSFYSKGFIQIHVKTLDSELRQLSDKMIHQFKGLFDNSQAIVSTNKQYLVFYKYINGIQEVVCYDLKNQTIKWKQALPKTKPRAYKYLDKMIVNNQGTAYYVEQVYEREEDRENLPSLVLYTIRDNTPPKEKVLKLYHKYYDFKLAYDRVHQRVVLAGFYGERKASSRYNQVDGVFSFRAGQDQQLILYPLDPVLDPNAKKEKELIIDNYEPAHLLVRNDGGILLLAEQKFIYSSSTTFDESIGNSDSKDYVYKDILAISIAPNGEGEWQEVLHKEQLSSNDEGRFSSFFIFKGRKGIRLVFNDNIHWESGMLEYIINGKGRIERNVISHHQKAFETILELRNSQQMDINTFWTLSKVKGSGNAALYLSRIRY